MSIAAPVESVEWRIDPEPVGYAEAVATMEERVSRIRAGKAPELVWLLEHPPLYTAGTSARDEDLLQPERFPVYRTGRGATAPAAAANTPITGRASGSPMSCST
jgi:lipoyl(octanoyl) transferase